MLEFNIVKENFILNGGVLKTSELKKPGLSTGQIKKLMESEKLHAIVSRMELTSRRKDFF